MMRTRDVGAQTFSQAVWMFIGVRLIAGRSSPSTPGHPRARAGFAGV